uniref:non-specific protein-tyrosine kinase n=1 Tax=Heterorhabditis bacteriophora TaxID=37862 RepID=A0A1I7XID6_HETBA
MPLLNEVKPGAVPIDGTTISGEEGASNGEGVVFSVVGEFSLSKLMQAADLMRYEPKLREELKLRNAADLQYVEEQDLTGIGMSRPEQKRLRKEYSKMYPSGIVGKLKKVFVRSESIDKRDIQIPIEEENDQHVIPIERITLVKELGQGEFGSVWQASWRGGTTGTESMQVAVKCVAPDKLVEAAIMTRMRHDNVVRLYGVVLDTKKVMMVSELATCGSLLQCLHKPALRDSFPVNVLCDYAEQIAKGMAYLESQRLIHRDLAARNVLVFSPKKVKISDFGLSRSLGVGEDYYRSEFSPSLKLPIAWCAPECINFLKFTSASDVWAFGVTLWEMFTQGQMPWNGMTGAQILEAVDLERRILERPSACPEDIYEIMKECWTHAYTDRPTFAQLIVQFPERMPQTVRAVCDCRDSAADHLQFKKDDLIVVIDRTPSAYPDGFYWTGCLRNGRVPKYHLVLKCCQLGLLMVVLRKKMKERTESVVKRYTNIYFTYLDKKELAPSSTSPSTVPQNGQLSSSPVLSQISPIHIRDNIGRAVSIGDTVLNKDAGSLGQMPITSLTSTSISNTHTSTFPGCDSVLKRPSEHNSVLASKFSINNYHFAEPTADNILCDELGHLERDLTDFSLSSINDFSDTRPLLNTMAVKDTMQQLKGNETASKFPLTSAVRVMSSEEMARWQDKQEREHKKAEGRLGVIKKKEAADIALEDPLVDKKSFSACLHSRHSFGTDWSSEAQEAYKLLVECGVGLKATPTPVVCSPLSSRASLERNENIVSMSDNKASSPSSLPPRPMTPPHILEREKPNDREVETQVTDYVPEKRIHVIETKLLNSADKGKIRMQDHHTPPGLPPKSYNYHKPPPRRPPKAKQVAISSNDQSANYDNLNGIGAGKIPPPVPPKPKIK